MWGWGVHDILALAGLRETSCENRGCLWSHRRLWPGPSLDWAPMMGRSVPRFLTEDAGLGAPTVSQEMPSPLVIEGPSALTTPQDRDTGHRCLIWANLAPLWSHGGKQTRCPLQEREGQGPKMIKMGSPLEPRVKMMGLGWADSAGLRLDRLGPSPSAVLSNLSQMGRLN